MIPLRSDRASARLLAGDTTGFSSRTGSLGMSTPSTRGTDRQCFYSAGHVIEIVVQCLPLTA